MPLLTAFSPQTFDATELIASEYGMFVYAIPGVIAVVDTALEARLGVVVERAVAR